MVPLFKADPRVDRLAIFVPPGDCWPELDAEVSVWTKADARLGLGGLKRRLRELAPDVVFIPTARWFDCGAVPTVIMVRNMEPLLVPFEGNPLPTKVKNLARAYSARRACQRATRIIAVSDHVRDFVVGRWKIPDERVGTVRHGVGEQVPTGERMRPAALGEGSDEFVFTAGSIRPARGLRDIVVAAARLKESGLPHRIVVGGAPDPDSVQYAADIKHLAAMLGVADRISWAGQLTAVEMAWCFSNCAAFAITSWAEACPNTVLEALSYGCLSVSTDQPPMPEFFAESAYYYPARDGEALARRLLEALNAPPAQQQAMRGGAVARASRYNWQTTAQRTLEELEIAMSAREQR
jgi:glycosyltransferase involved in cell wall biosynthesis